MKSYWEERVKLEGDCWIWQLCVGKNGYGFCKGSTAHKRSYEDHIGPVPKGKVLRHTCDNKRCCNPHHLVIGSQRDNYYDMSEEKRLLLHQKAGETYSQRVAIGEIIIDSENQRERGRLGGLNNKDKPKSKSHKAAISKSLKRG